MWNCTVYLCSEPLALTKKNFVYPSMLGNIVEWIVQLQNVHMQGGGVTFLNASLCKKKCKQKTRSTGNNLAEDYGLGVLDFCNQEMFNIGGEPGP